MPTPNIGIKRQEHRTTLLKQPSPHAGEVLLEEFLIPLGISQVDFAKRLKWTKAKLNELIRAKCGITAESALDLAEALKTSANIWMNMQATYDLAKAMKQRKISPKAA